MKEYSRSTSCGNVKVSIDEQIAHVTVKGDMNELLVTYTLSKLVEVAAETDTRPWGLLWHSETTFSPTPKALEIMSNALQLCADNGCIQDAVVCSSPAFLTEFKQYRVEKGSIDALKGAYFKTIDEAKTFLWSKISGDAH